MTRILFACVGNSARSQMAEGFCRALGRDVECASAGTNPARAVLPLAVASMKEGGIDISQSRPKGFDSLTGKWDYLVTMGCEVECPFVPGAKLVEWDIPGPVTSDIAEYHHIRDMIHSKVRDLLDSLGRLAHEPRDDHQPLG